MAFCASLLMLLLAVPSVRAQTETGPYFWIEARRTESAGNYYSEELWHAEFIDNDVPSDRASLQDFDSYAVTYMAYGENESGFWAKTIVWGTLQYTNITNDLPDYSLSGFWWTPSGI